MREILKNVKEKLVDKYLEKTPSKIRKKFKSAFIFRPEYLSDDNNEENIN